MPEHDYTSKSLVLRKPMLLTRNWLLILSFITEQLKAIPFYPYSPAESWAKIQRYSEQYLRHETISIFPAEAYCFSSWLCACTKVQILSWKDIQQFRFWLKHHDVALITTFTPFLRAAAFLFFFAHLWTTESFLYHKNVFIKSFSAFSLFLVFCIL